MHLTTPSPKPTNQKRIFKGIKYKKKIVISKIPRFNSSKIYRLAVKSTYLNLFQGFCFNNLSAFCQTSFHHMRHCPKESTKNFIAKLERCANTNKVRLILEQNLESLLDKNLLEELDFPVRSILPFVLWELLLLLLWECCSCCCRHFWATACRHFVVLLLYFCE